MRLNVKYGVPCEGFSTLSFYLLHLLNEINSQIRGSKPRDHVEFENDLKGRALAAGIDENHYLLKTLELAVMETKQSFCTYELFRDWEYYDWTSDWTSALKKNLSLYASFGMYKTLAGAEVKVELDAGLRRFMPWSIGRPMVDHTLTFSTSPAAENITVPESVYCGKSPAPETKGKPLNLKAIAQRVTALQAPMNAREIVQEVMAGTCRPHEAEFLVTEEVVKTFQKLPKVKPETSDAISPIEAKSYFWDKKPNPQEVLRINP
jgi:hypothetical protein